jgi:hypothetical protein
VNSADILLKIDTFHQKTAMRVEEGSHIGLLLALHGVMTMTTHIEDAALARDHQHAGMITTADVPPLLLDIESVIEKATAHP